VKRTNYILSFSDASYEIPSLGGIASAGVNVVLPSSIIFCCGYSCPTENLPEAFRF